jgi:hypothetical protein
MTLSVLSPSDVYLWDPSPSAVYLWDTRVTHLWCLQFIIKVSTRSFLYPTCTYGTLLHPTYGTRHPTCTYGTYSYSSVTLAIHHKSLRSFLSPSDMYMQDPSASDLWDPSASNLWNPVGPFASDLWDLTAYMSCLPEGPFSFSIRPVGPDSLCATGV